MTYVPYVHVHGLGECSSWLQPSIVIHMTSAKGVELSPLLAPKSVASTHYFRQAFNNSRITHCGPATPWYQMAEAIGGILLESSGLATCIIAHPRVAQGVNSPLVIITVKHKYR